MSGDNETCPFYSVNGNSQTGFIWKIKVLSGVKFDLKFSDNFVTISTKVYPNLWKHLGVFLV